MQITCASCKTTYNLTMDQIQGLSGSILPCNTCNKFIKITTCPHCKSFYSITFSSAQQNSYCLTCQRCSREFEIEFPIIKEGVKSDGPPEKAKAAEKEIPIRKNIFPADAKADMTRPVPPRRENQATATGGSPPRLDHSTSFTLESLFSLCGTAFSVRKLATAASLIIAAFLLLMGTNRLLDIALEPGDVIGNELIKSLLNILPFAILFFLYLAGAAIISRITMNDMHLTRVSSSLRISTFLAKSLIHIFLANIVIFVVIDLVFILFGRIPVIGPILFALLFLPIYATSLCAVILLAIGFWFYPPIIAASVPEGKSPIRILFAFIRNRNFSLAYTIPILTIITAVTFAAMYMLHYGSFTLSIFLSKTVLGEDALKTFSSIPAPLLRFSDLTVIGSDSGLYKSLLDNLLMTHTVGGFIIGILFSIISILLFSSFISITATLSTHFYLMIEQGNDLDDSGKIRLLALLVLILLGVFLVKKIFF